MAWYDTGTVSVTNGSTAVVGSGTNFISGAQIGEAFYGPDGRLYEIQTIVSATSLTLADPYLGSTQSGQVYKIVPTQSLVATLAAEVSELITDFQTVKDEAGAGKFQDGTAALPAITFNLDQDTGFSRPAANQIGFSTAGVQRALLTSTGLNAVAIGATTPSTIAGTTGSFSGDLTIADKIVHSGDTNTALRFPANDTVTVETNGAERMRVTSAGNVGIGTSSPNGKLTVRRDSGSAITLQSVQSGVGNLNSIDFQNLFSSGTDGNATARISAFTQSNVDAGGLAFSTSSVGNITTNITERMRIDSAGNVGIGTTSPAQALDVIGAIQASTFFQGAIDGTAAAPLYRLNDADTGFFRPANNEIGFTAGGTERMRIDSTGNVLVGRTASGGGSKGVQLLVTGLGAFYVEGNTCQIIDRLTNDGTLVEFRQGGVSEGSISVSGSTVSYNGGHLSRWAQFPDNSRPELLKGTVMSNLDQMSNWDNEDNEQLNCVQVSTVEGDANVAGVFVVWDSTDDGYNDILLAMTGDMVIRIGAGVTVQRGDLLMSAGDGTAMPQGDDIVRSKTIAKVTSTHVSHTYEDGSYAVPCVLMAC
jgi:hypothetical protein